MNTLYIFEYLCKLQEALAIGFELEMERFGQPECYFHSLAQELQPKRDYMAKFLSDVGMVPTIPEGGYFMVANWTSLENKVKLNEETDKYKDYRFTKWMIKNVGLQGIPPSAFYGPDHRYLGQDYVRYCFIKVSGTTWIMATAFVKHRRCVFTERREFGGCCWYLEKMGI